MRMLHEETVCRKIFELLLPYSRQDDSPIAYITAKIGYECPLMEHSLIDTFNRVKWDSELSAADINIIRVMEHEIIPGPVVLASFTRFESDGEEHTTGFQPPFVVVEKLKDLTE
jgi:hypothetical protein